MKNARIRRRVSAVALNALLAVLAVLLAVSGPLVHSAPAEHGGKELRAALVVLVEEHLRDTGLPQHKGARPAGTMSDIGDRAGCVCACL